MIKKKIIQLAKLLSKLKRLFTKEFWRNLPSSIKRDTISFLKETSRLMSFFALVLIQISRELIEKTRRTFLWPFIQKIQNSFLGKKIKQATDNLIIRFDSREGNYKMRRSYIISLARQNMNLKKSRSMITIGGVAIGIGAIVLLVSLGYGLERLVIRKVTRLEELKMTDVYTGQSTALALNQGVIKKVKEIPKVKDVVPVVSIVGRVSFNNANLDVLAYAAPKSYLEYSQIELVKGKLFVNNDILYERREKVAGVSIEAEEATFGDKVSEEKIHFNLLPETAVTVRRQPDIGSTILGFTRRIEGGLWGQEYWGDSYHSEVGAGRVGFDEEKLGFLGKWIKAKFPLYEKVDDDRLTPVLGDLGRPLWEWGWVMEDEVQFLERLEIGEILGDSIDLEESVLGTESASIIDPVVISTDSAGVEWVEIKTATDSAKEKTVVNFEEKPTGEALISSGMLRVFNLSAGEAIGKKFKVSFIIVRNLMPEVGSKVLSEEVEYNVIGVIDDEASPYFFIPFIDLARVGVTNYSQLRVISEDADSLVAIRKEIETLGFRTTSTVDTVAQIESLFANLRLLLGFLGMVALAVAILGMFNTLTVSLLERTREIGGMKAIGMSSSEVRDLLLAEAMIMGFSGGILGLIFGFALGKVLSLAVSIMALVNGEGLLNLSYIPPGFTAFVVIASFAVGVLTGLYPAKRATKISALDALRYE